MSEDAVKARRDYSREYRKKKKDELSEEQQERVREMKRAYQREWRRRNKDKVKAYNAQYWERRAERMKAEEWRDGQ